MIKVLVLCGAVVFDTDIEPDFSFIQRVGVSAVSEYSSPSFTENIVVNNVADKSDAFLLCHNSIKPFLGKGIIKFFAVRKMPGGGDVFSLCNYKVFNSLSIGIVTPSSRNCNSHISSGRLAYISYAYEIFRRFTNPEIFYPRVKAVDVCTGLANSNFTSYSNGVLCRRGGFLSLIQSSPRIDQGTPKKEHRTNSEGCHDPLCKRILRRNQTSGPVPPLWFIGIFIVCGVIFALVSTYAVPKIIEFLTPNQ